MRALHIFPLLLLISISAMSQEEKIESGSSENLYKVKIIHMNGKTTRGYAYILSEDKISVFNPPVYVTDSKHLQTGNSETIVQYPALDIKKITFREKNKLRNNVLRGILIGVISGFAFSLIKSEGIAIPIGDLFVLDFTHPPVPVNNPKIILHGATAGAAFGVITGFTSASFTIKGKKELFRENQEKMNKYMMAYQQAPAF